MIKNNITKYSLRRWWIAGIVLSLAILTIIWFAFFPDRAFFADDFNLIVNALSGGYASSFVKAFTYAGINYRPFFAAFFHLVSLIFGKDFNSYIYLNIFLEFLNACMVSFIGYKLSRNQLFVAFVSGVMFIVSRFSYYNVLQVYGSMMGLALFLFLLMIYTTIHAYETKKPISLVWPLLFYYFVIFTYEGYIAVGGFLVFAIILAPIKFRARYHRFALTVVPVILLMFNYLLKTFVLHINFFQGTGGVPIAFDYHQFFHFMGTGFANMLGLNVGPNYLSGLDISNAGITGYIIGGIFTVLITILIAAYIYNRFPSVRKSHLSEGKYIFLFFALFVPLLASASITFRQEYRWLYAPYVIVIFGIAYLSSKISSRKWLNFALIFCILISAVSIDNFYRGYLDNVFFMGWLKTGADVKSNIIDKYGSVLPQKELFFISDSKDRENWSFMDSTFFKFYTGDPEIQMHFIDSAEDIKNYQVNIDNILVFSYDLSKRKIINVNQEVKDAIAKVIGADDETAIGICGPDYMHMGRFTALRSDVVNEFRIECVDTGSVKVAIYADKDGLPGSLLNAVNTSIPVVAGWNNIVFPATPLTAGNAYWLALNSSQRIVGYAEGSNPVIFQYSPYDNHVFLQSISGTYNKGSGLLLISGFNSNY
jgi:hypothetical protein